MVTKGLGHCLSDGRMAQRQPDGHPQACHLKGVFVQMDVKGEPKVYYTIAKSILELSASERAS